MNYHPHVHALVLAGILKYTIFHEQTNISTTVIAEIFRARLLAVFVQTLVSVQALDMLMTWNHNSGFNVHTSEKINGSDGDAIEKVARYMSRAAISLYLNEGYCVHHRAKIGKEDIGPHWRKDEEGAASLPLYYSHGC
ncbi:MAG: hypothetical protein GY941_18305 [Planctomycetes bacterium]|nr:hypothetical protein [Planctomycetota bacterium]